VETNWACDRSNENTNGSNCAKAKGWKTKKNPGKIGKEADDKEEGDNERKNYSALQ
jgi:hypothetical protein